MNANKKQNYVFLLWPVIIDLIKWKGIQRNDAYSALISTQIIIIIIIECVYLALKHNAPDTKIAIGLASRCKVFNSCVFMKYKRTHILLVLCMLYLRFGEIILKLCAARCEKKHNQTVVNTEGC